MRKASWIILSAFLAFAVGCGGSKPSNQIVGKWNAELPKDAPKELAGMMPVMEFKNDGVLIMSMGPINMNAKYKFVADDTMEVEMDVPGKGKDAKKMKVEIKGDEMTTTELEGKKEVSKFKKAK